MVTIQLVSIPSVADGAAIILFAWVLAQALFILQEWLRSGKTVAG